MHRILQRCAVAVAAGALITACGGDSNGAVLPTTAPPSAPGDTTAADASTSTVPPSTAVAPGLAIGGSSEDARLLTYAYALGGLYEISREEAVAFLSENIPENEIESCMNSAGFEYIPEQSPEEMIATDIRYSMSPEEYAAKYGLGIVGADLGVIPPLREPRNQTAESAMTASERDAYQASLGQCRGMWDPERRSWSNAINVAMEQFRPVVDADPRMATALADWQSCLASAGFDFDSPMQMRESFYARMNTNRTESLEAIFDDEIRVAVANVPCEAGHDAARRQVISERLPELKAIVDAARASGAAPEGNG